MSLLKKKKKRCHAGRPWKHLHLFDTAFHKCLDTQIYLKKTEESIGGGGGGGVRTPVAAARYKNRPRRFF